MIEGLACRMEDRGETYLKGYHTKHPRWSTNLFSVRGPETTRKEILVAHEQEYPDVKNFCTTEEAALRGVESLRCRADSCMGIRDHRMEGLEGNLETAALDLQDAF